LGGVEGDEDVVDGWGALDTDGLDIDEDDLNLLLSADTQTWKREATLICEHLRTFGGHLPSTFWDQYHDLLRRPG
jgi:phosphoenolpyruvate carboxykinase (GTP)